NKRFQLARVVRRLPADLSNAGEVVSKVGRAVPAAAGQRAVQFPITGLAFGTPSRLLVAGATTETSVRAPLSGTVGGAYNGSTLWLQPADDSTAEFEPLMPTLVERVARVAPSKEALVEAARRTMVGGGVPRP